MTKQLERDLRQHFGAVGVVAQLDALANDHKKIHELESRAQKIAAQLETKREQLRHENDPATKARRRAEYEVAAADALERGEPAEPRRDLAAELARQIQRLDTRRHDLQREASAERHRVGAAERTVIEGAILGFTVPRVRELLAQLQPLVAIYSQVERGDADLRVAADGPELFVHAHGLEPLEAVDVRGLVEQLRAASNKKSTHAQAAEEARA